MQKMENTPNKGNGDPNHSLKLAIAMAIIKSRRDSSSSVTATTTVANNAYSERLCRNVSESDAIKWKRKAKQRKEEIIRLKEDLKLAEDGMHHDIFPENVSCKCYFFDNLGERSPKITVNGSESDQKKFGDVLRRRFLRQVRLSERKRRRLDCSSERSFAESENELEQLRAAVDFLVELCQTSSPVRIEEGHFKNWSHQAVDFILATLKALSSSASINETVESVMSSLILRLMRRICNESRGDELHCSHNNFQFYVQHLMRQLGSDSYIGQRMILSASQRISVVGESLLLMDPFDLAFPKMQNCMYIMIQLIEFLVSDHLLSWSASQEFDLKILEEWVASVFHARKALELLESRNTLYVLFIDRVIGDLTRQLGQVSLVQKLQPDILAKLFG